MYNPTSLERNYKHELLTEVDLGVPIDLILPELTHQEGQVCVTAPTCMFV